MSLYTISFSDKLPSITIPAGLSMEESSDITLLSILGNTTANDVTRRLANDNLAFIAYMHGQPAAFGWMARGKVTIGELNHTFILPEGNRYLWNFRTMEAYRGLGIYPALLQYILKSEDAKASRFWIIHAPENKSSLKGIRKSGFEYVGKLYIGENDQITIEANPKAKTYQALLEYMDIELSSQTAASCWNCSSPYLKRRQMTCCCAKAGNECIGNSILAMAL